MTALQADDVEMSLAKWRDVLMASLEDESKLSAVISKGMRRPEALLACWKV